MCGEARGTYSLQRQRRVPDMGGFSVTRQPPEYGDAHHLSKSDSA